MDTARLRLPSRPTAESGATSANGSGDNANSNISGISGKSHLAAQCAPIKPARSSIAPLAVPINKLQPIEKSTNIGLNRTVLADPNKSSTFRNNEALESTDETSRVQKRYSLNVENTNNKFLSRSECTKNNDQTTNETTRDLNAESRNETINTDNLIQQQEQQHRETTSPNIVSSTASPSPPPSNGSMNARNEDSANNGDTSINSNNSNENNNATSCQTKNSSEVTCSKSPDSPDSSSITVENSGTSKSSTLTDQEMATDTQTSSDTIKTSESIVNPDNTVDDSTTTDDKNKFANKSEASEIAKQLTSVQKRLLAVFPSTEWANNPIAAEHLGNFLKSLNVTIKSEGSKMEKIDQKTIGNNDNENR